MARAREEGGRGGSAYFINVNFKASTCWLSGFRRRRQQPSRVGLLFSCRLSKTPPTAAPSPLSNISVSAPGAGGPRTDFPLPVHVTDSCCCRKGLTCWTWPTRECFFLFFPSSFSAFVGTLGRRHLFGRRRHQAAEQN